jgi:hypothetical protein
VVFDKHENTLFLTRNHYNESKQTCSANVIQAVNNVFTPEDQVLLASAINKLATELDKIENQTVKNKVQELIDHVNNIKDQEPALILIDALNDTIDILEQKITPETYKTKASQFQGAPSTLVKTMASIMEWIGENLSFFSMLKSAGLSLKAGKGLFKIANDLTVGLTPDNLLKSSLEF